MSLQTYFSVCAPRPGYPEGDRFPYGICGPFLDADEAEKAMTLLQSVMPGRELAIIAGQNADDSPWLIDDQECARAKLRHRTKVS